jgi:hypothetical protein
MRFSLRIQGAFTFSLAYTFVCRFGFLAFFCALISRTLFYLNVHWLIPFVDRFGFPAYCQPFVEKHKR